MVCPLHNSRAARQTTSGRSPSFDTNSKSTHQTCSKGRSFLGTRRPPQVQRMVDAVDQPTFVLEREPEDFCRLELGPRGIETDERGILGGGEAHVTPVLHVAVHPH